MYNPGIKTFTATEALEAARRVKLTSGSGTHVEYADDSDDYIGVTKKSGYLGVHTCSIEKSISGIGRNYCICIDYRRRNYLWS